MYITSDKIKSVVDYSLNCDIKLLGISTRKNYRRGEEYGSAIWGVANQVNKKYMQKPINQNKILTQNVKIGLKAQKHRRNLNTLVCGGSRSRKNKIFCKTKCYAM